jgi:hypothetical protein
MRPTLMVMRLPSEPCRHLALPSFRTNQFADVSCSTTHTGSAVASAACDGIPYAQPMQTLLRKGRVCGHGDATDQKRHINQVKARRRVVDAYSHAASSQVRLPRLCGQDLFRFSSWTVVQRPTRAVVLPLSSQL